jgi:hypothetical protein
VGVEVNPAHLFCFLLFPFEMPNFYPLAGAFKSTSFTMFWQSKAHQILRPENALAT